MNPRLLMALVAGALAVAGGAGWFWYQDRKAAELPMASEVVSVDETPAPVAEVPGQPEHPLDPPPVEEGSTAEVLPPLAESDAPIAQELSRLAGEGTVLSFLVPEGIARRFVATVDNLSRSHVAERSRVLRGAQGPLLVERTVLDATTGEERIVLSPDNAARYDGAIAALQGLDMRLVAAAYRRFYPLFQHSYEDLGYPGRHFNDRVVAVIDHLLQTPVPGDPPQLVQPKVLYEFADRSLEARSAGQKLLIRMGPEHAAAVKAQLTALRAEIASNEE